MQKAYIIRNPIYNYAFDFIKVLEEQYQMLPILWFTDRDLYFHQLYRLPFAHRWHDRVYFASDAQLPELLRLLDQRFEICLALPWEEAAVETAAQIMQHYGLPGPDPELMLTFRDKYRLKTYLLEKDPELPLHAFFEVTSYEDFQKRAAVLPERYVVKPVNGVANCANGFFSKQTPESTLNQFFRENAFQRFIIEEFLEGDEFAVNGQVDAAGQVTVIAVFRYERKPANGRPNLYYRDWLLHENTSQFKVLTDYAVRVMKASGLKASPFHMELMLVRNQAYLIEVGARLAGGHLIYVMDQAHGEGMNSFRLALQNYLVEKTSGPIPTNWPLYNSSQHVLLTGIADRNDTVITLQGIREIEALPEFFLWFKKPEWSAPIKVTVDGESTPYALHLFTRGPQASLLASADFVQKNLGWNRQLSFWRRKFFSAVHQPLYKLYYHCYFLGIKLRFGFHARPSFRGRGPAA